MKSQNKLLYAITFLFIVITTKVFAQNTNPVVSNVAFSISGTTVTVTYDVFDAEENSFTVYMEVSSNGGATWNYNYGTATGDIGANVAEGNGKTITWTYQGDYNSDFMIKILADDLYGDQIYYAGQIYNTVTIGTQTWLKENLNYETANSWCYGNTAANCITYGRLYTWQAAMNGSTTEGAQGICPEGWHIPTIAEFQSLEAYVNDKVAALVDTSAALNYTPDVTQNWSGFSALFAGYRGFSGTFYGFVNFALFWSSTEYDSYDAYDMSLRYDYDYRFVNLENSQKDYGFSVRCIKN
jgi:uncharacterized protein (TIGR02145 family)